jgi:hypothetical protein
MFRPGGAWREFGLSDSKQSTLFPFWMFALVWALISYAIATCFMIVTSSLANSSPGLEVFSTPDVEPVPVKQPGYYIINPNRANSSGANYVYYGSSPPSPEEVASFVSK